MNDKNMLFNYSDDEYFDSYYGDDEEEENSKWQ